MDSERVYVVTYMGETLDVLDTLEEARAMRADLVRRIRANQIPDFLDADDIDGVNDFPIQVGRWENYR